jgi:hypothetical protein
VTWLHQIFNYLATAISALLFKVFDWVVLILHTTIPYIFK